MLDSARQFFVPSDTVHETETALRKAGEDGWELFVLWSGVQREADFEVRTMHIPEQRSYKTAEGLLVRVEGPALHRMNVELYERDETLAVQVHAHPTHAFHSDTDSTYPIMTTLGGLSIVAADFCVDGLFAQTTAAYRLSRRGWQHVGRRQLSKLVMVT
jgi:hypothetical protein